MVRCGGVVRPVDVVLTHACLRPREAKKGSGDDVPSQGFGDEIPKASHVEAGIREEPKATILILKKRIRINCTKGKFA